MFDATKNRDKAKTPTNRGTVAGGVEKYIHGFQQRDAVSLLILTDFVVQTWFRCRHEHERQQMREKIGNLTERVPTSFRVLEKQMELRLGRDSTRRLSGALFKCNVSESCPDDADLIHAGI